MRSPAFQARFWVKVDRSGGPEACWPWLAGTDGDYGQIGLHGRMTPAHRIAYMLAHGAIPNGMLVDHICLNKLCINASHLRLATRKQNAEHLSGAHRDSKTGVRGVFWNTEKGKYQAKIGHSGKHFHVGYFDDIADAEAAVVAKRLELFTHNDLDRATA